MAKSYILFFLLVFYGCVYIPRNHQYNVNAQSSRFQGEIEIGMTQQQVIDQWGEPDSIIRVQKEDYDEIWIYVPHWKFKNYLYFKNSLLIRGEPEPGDLV